MNELPPKGDMQASKLRFLYCAQQNLLKHAIPIVKGGLGDNYTALVQAHVNLGKSSLDCGLILSLNAHLWGAVFPIINFGNQAQQKSYLAKLLSGKMLGGHAITEPQAGSDVKALKMTAKSSTEGLILNGHKRFITNTPIADLLVVYAHLENKLSSFIVHANDPGAHFLDNPQVTGCKTATMGDVILQDCLIPHSRQLGKTGGGNLMIQQALELERAFIFAGFSGVMDWQLHTAIQYSRRRSINGRHLGKNQAISHTIAEMKLRLDTIRLWLNECAQLKDNSKRITMASAQTKLFAAEAFLQSSLDAVHILGSSGLLQEGLIAELVNDALSSRLFSGSSEIQKNIISALLGTGEGYHPKDF